jgi:hypothetical protein
VQFDAVALAHLTGADALYREIGDGFRPDGRGQPRGG